MVPGMTERERLAADVRLCTWLADARLGPTLTAVSPAGVKTSVPRSPRSVLEDRVMKRLHFLVCLALVVLAAAVPAVAGPRDAGLYPDLRTVVPTHLGIQNQQQREILRFSNGIANTGPGPWRMRPEPPPGSDTQVTNGVQEILDADGAVVLEQVVSTFEYHPAHNHWHIGDVALFEVRKARDNGHGGDIGGVVTNDRGEAQSIKTTFCLIDSYKLDDNAPTKERGYWDCYTSYQGISPGWADQYHQATVGQQLDLTGAPEGVYYLVSTSNPAGVFLETDPANNTAWTSFRLRRDSEGNPKITLIDHSACESPGMCGERSTNR